MIEVGDALLIAQYNVGLRGCLVCIEGIISFYSPNAFLGRLIRMNSLWLSAP